MLNGCDPGALAEVASWQPVTAAVDGAVRLLLHYHVLDHFPHFATRGKVLSNAPQLRRRSTTCQH